MDVIGQALAFSIRVTIWLFQWFFEFSTSITYSSFGGLYRRSRAGAWVAVVIIWVVVWALIFSLLGSPSAALSGLVFGMVWAVVLVLRVSAVWEEDIAFLREQEPQKPEIFQTPLLPIQEAKPTEVVDEFDDAELMEKV